MAGAVTYSELCTIMSLRDLFQINAILDAKEKIENEQYQKQMRSTE